MRIIVFTGYGGSGVSTLAAATAAALGPSGRRTLAFSMNQGLGRAFDADLRDEGVEVAANVTAVESRRQRDRPDELRDWLAALLNWRGMDDVLADDMASLPGVSHVGRLLDLERHVSSGEYEVVVIDGAPVAQFLELPPALDSAARWLRRLFAPREQTLFEPFLRAFAGDYATTGEDVMERGRNLLSRLVGLRELLADGESASVRIVTPADSDAEERLRSAITAFHLYSYATDAVVLSRLLPQEGGGDFFEHLYADQERALRAVDGALGGVPVLRKPLIATAPRGEEALLELASRVYGERAPDGVLYRSEARRTAREDGRFEMRITLPHASKEDLALEQIDDSLVVHLGEHRCVLLLPEDVCDWQADSWSFSDQTLSVTFRP